MVAKKVAQNLDYYLSACQLGITITALVLGALGEPTVEKMLHPLFESLEVPAALSTVLSYAIALAFITFLHVVIGELAPKTLAIQFAEKMTLLLAPPLYWFGKIMNPFIYALNGAARLLLSIFGIKPAGHDTVHSEEELKLIMAQSYESGEINQTELDYLKNILPLMSVCFQEIMIPRDKIVTLSKEMPLDQIIEVLNQHEYTRYPVIANGDVNHFVGFINTKQTLTGVAAGRTFSMNTFMHPMPSFSERSPIKDVLVQMQHSRVHIASVKDEAGATIGMVTMEDILEEIVGDIKDEYEHKDLVNPPKKLKLV